MSFIKEVKQEIISKKIENDCCNICFLSGIIFSVGEVEELGEGEYSLSFSCDSYEIYKYVEEIVKKYYGCDLICQKDDSPMLNKSENYKIKFPNFISRQVLLDCGKLKQEQAGFKIIDDFDQLLKDECCERNFVKAVFLFSGTSSIKLSEKAYEKSTSGYHLEFTSHYYGFLDDISKVLATKGILAKLVERKRQFVLYLKEAQQICDLLTFVEAYDSVLALQNEIASREMRNAVNRQTNCLSANISKTVSANMKQLEAIDIIDSTIGIDSLPSELQDVVLLRLANTEESLSELVRLNPNLTKSGLNHRFRKLIKLAEELKE